MLRLLSFGVGHSYDFPVLDISFLDEVKHSKYSQIVMKL